jgi:poly(hydroxyalkanoate) depolymerase family esterase
VARRRKNPGLAMFRAFTPRRAPVRSRRRMAPVRSPRRVAPKPRKAAAPPGAGRRYPARFVGPSGTRSYLVYVPAGLRRTTRAPLLVLLHGCGQSGADLATVTRFNQLADRHGLILVYPEQLTAAHTARCWRWFEAAHQARGSGEPAILAGITAQVLAEQVRWRIDPERVYVAGLSAGGAMALVLGATYPDVYAAVGVHSATAYRSANGSRAALRAMNGTAAPPPLARPGRSPHALPPTIVVQGSVDRTVRPVNATRIAQQWLAYRAAANPSPTNPARVTRSRVTRTRPGAARSATTTRWYTARGHKVLEIVTVDGLGHAWSGGAKGLAYSDPRGPRATTAIWSFLSAQRLSSAAT